MSKEKNIVIIGAGAVGLCCGYHLAKDGADVTILEKNYAGSGQSTRTGGDIRYLHGSQENVQMSFLSKSFWDNFENNFGISVNYKPTGHLFLTSDQKKN